LTLKNDIYSNFALRLEHALESKVIRKSPTVLANLFNSKFGGKSVTPHTARNWMLGKSLPTQDKLVCLAELLGTSSEYLRFGTNNNKTFVISQNDGTSNELTDQQQQFVRRYLKLNIVQQKLISELVEELKS
jgi:hypothetical protein